MQCLSQLFRNICYNVFISGGRTNVKKNMNMKYAIHEDLDAMLQTFMDDNDLTVKFDNKINMP